MVPKSARVRPAPTAAGRPPSGSRPFAVIVGGVSGCGKSTVGALLATRLHCSFVEADDFHPASNRSKMRSGVPLCDADRWPWLDALGREFRVATGAGTASAGALSAGDKAGPGDERGAGALRGRVAASCSSLTPAHRARLRAACAPVETMFVMLAPSRSNLEQRVAARAAVGGHFMPPSLLDSQLDTLDLGDGSDFLALYRDEPFPAPDAIVDQIVDRLSEDGWV